MTVGSRLKTDVRCVSRAFGIPSPTCWENQLVGFGCLIGGGLPVDKTRSREKTWPSSKLNSAVFFFWSGDGFNTI